MYMLVTDKGQISTEQLLYSTFCWERVGEITAVLCSIHIGVKKMKFQQNTK